MRGRLASAILFIAIIGLRPVAAFATPPVTYEAAIRAAKSAMMATPETAYKEAQAARDAAEKKPAGSDREIALATGTWLSAEALTRLGQPEKALRILDPALEVIARVAPESQLQGDVLRSHGATSEAVGRVQRALEDYQAAFQIYQRAKVPRSEAIVLQEIGSIYSDARDYTNVLKYNEQSSEIYGLDPMLNLASHNNRGVALKDMGRLAEAETEFAQALKAAVDLHSSHLQAGILTSLAYAEVQAGQIGAARANVARGFALAGRDAEAGGERPFLTGVLAAIQAKEGDDMAAAKSLDQLFTGRNLQSTPMALRDFHEIAAGVYERTGDDVKALAHLKAFKRLDDQGRSLAASTNTALMAARFDFANQNLRITALKTGELARDVKLARSAARLHDVVATGVLVGGGLMLAAAALGLIGMRRSRDRVRSVNARLEIANAALEKALRAKGEFLATTSHEIRTPLNGVLGMAEIILADAALPPGTRDRVQSLHAAGETMRLLVDDLLDMAKIETGGVSISAAPFDLPEALDKAGRFWSGRAELKGLRLDLEVDPALGRVVGDERRFNQVVYNLMSNALKFTEHGSVTLGAVADGEWCEVSVSDTGIGVPETQQVAIFEPFVQVDSGTTRAYGGTGLGLSICREIARAMGGEIGVARRDGGGSVFTLRTPLVVADSPVVPAVAPTVGAPEAAARDLSRSTLLVLDANPINASVLRALLQTRTTRVALATSLPDAKAQMQACAFDLVLAERSALLGGGQSLACACDVLRVGSHVRLALLTPVDDSDEAVRLVAAGRLDAILVKPLSGDALVAGLEDALAREPLAAHTAVAA